MAPAADGVDAQPRARSTRTSSLRILTKLTDAEIFEQFIHKNYVGAKRFSLEGAESMIPLLDLLIEAAGAARHRGDRHRHGAPRAPQRARRTSWARTCARSSPRSTTRTPERFLGGGDVKYHLGYSSDVVDAVGGSQVHLSLAFNPSHLEFVNPVVEGRVRAKQRPRQAQEHDAAAHPRRRGVHGPGRRRRDAEPRGLEGYTTGGTDPPRRQQPDRLHDDPERLALDALLHRHRADAAASPSST